MVAKRKNRSWKFAPPHFVVEAVGRAAITLPEGYSLSNNKYARAGNNLMIRSLDGVIVSVRGYFANSEHPVLVEYGAPEKRAAGPIIGEMKGKSAFDAPCENNADSYSIAQTDTNSVIFDGD